MKIQKIKDMDIKVPDTSAFTIKTADGLPKLHSLMLSISKRGGGKTVSIINLIKKLQDTGACDRLFIISPTIKSNKGAIDCKCSVTLLLAINRVSPSLLFVKPQSTGR